MKKRTTLRAALMTGLAIGAWVGLAGTALAQTPPSGPQTPQADKPDRVVVTGSLIKGTPEDAAIPVDVISSDSLKEQGSPTLVDLIRTIPSVSGGNIGESNRFLGNAAAGVATVNLRGLGLTRTLPLMNGERLAPITAAGGQEFVNINVVPSIAIGQVEVLRDGAAATYGSDAVAGVVNFITRRDLRGFEASAHYSLIDGSDGDYDAAGAWGGQFDNGTLMLAAEYRHRSQLNGVDLPFTLPNRVFPDAVNISGVSGASNPGGFNIITGTPVRGANGGYLSNPAAPGTPLGGALSATIFDAGCTGLGGLQFAAQGQCFFPFGYHDTRVAEENHYHLFGEANFDLSNTLRFHGEVLWARSDVPHDRVSASQSTVQFPAPIEASGASAGGGTSLFPAAPGAIQSRYYVPGNNPGLVALFNSCPSTAITALTPALCTAALANGLTMSQTAWRPYALGGNPLFNNDADEQSNQITSFRALGGFSGDLGNNMEWATSINYMRTEQYNETPDRLVNRVQLALRGLGGPNCNTVTGTPGAGGCLWFNPFANAIQKSSINGANYNSVTGLTQGPENTRELAAWMQENATGQIVQQLFTAQATLTGDLGGFKLMTNEPISWAIGTQWRYNDRTVQYSTNFDGNKTPCVDSQPYGDGLPTCNSPGNGPFTFIGSGTESQYDSSVTSVFGELKVPILDNLEASLAVRYEQYGGNIGSTTNPRLSAKWQVLPWLAVRGSAGSTFRAPPASAIAPGYGTIQAQFTNPTNSASLYRPVLTFGNPDLQPETADTYNVGFLVDIGGFKSQLDYFHFDFKDEITTETAARIYGTMFPSASPATWGCGNAALLSRFTFGTDVTNTQTYNGATVPTCHPTNFLSIRNNVINGPSTEVSGIDFNASYLWEKVWIGDLTIGGDASLLTNFYRDQSYLLGTNIVYEAALNRVNKSELLSSFYSYPRWRGNLFLDYSFENASVRWTSRYWAGTIDRNACVTAAGTNAAAGSATCVSYPTRDSRWVHDVVMLYTLPSNTTLSLAITNVFDDEPPFYKSQYNYDYTTQSPLGRVFKIGVQQKF